MKDTHNSKSDQWTAGYLAVADSLLLHSIRVSFQKKAFACFIEDKESKILDVGCGNGHFIQFLNQQGYNKVYGVDPNEELIQQIHENKIFDASLIRLGYSNNLPYEDESFDYIYFFNVLHHLPTTELYIETVEEVSRCLKPGGKIIIIEPCNEIIYSTKRFFARLLSYVSGFFSDMYHMMAAEKKDVTLFFHNYHLIQEKFSELGYVVLRDKKILHQWTFVVRKHEK